MVLRRIGCAAVVAVFAGAASVHAEQGVSLGSGFTDFTAWTLLGSAQARNETPGNGFTYSTLQLTVPGGEGQAGAAFAPQSLVLDFNQSFRFDFHFFISGTQLRGDGFTFVLAATPEYGGTGSGLGYEGLQHSVAFAVDTFNFDDEPVSPSLQILHDGFVAPLAVTETGLGDAIRAQDYQFYASVRYTPSGQGNEQGTLVGRVEHLTLGSFEVMAAVDFSGVGEAVLGEDGATLLGRTVHYGFTASTGAATDGHFITSAMPVPEPSTYAMLLAGGLLLAGVARRRRPRGQA